MVDGKPPPGASIEVLLDPIVRHVPAPSGNADLPFSMLVTMLEHDNYLGRICTGRVATGSVKEGDTIKLLPVSSGIEEEGRVRAATVLNVRLIVGQFFKIASVKKT